MGVATSGWQLLFATREKTKVMGEPFGRRPDNTSVFYGKKHDFGSKGVLLFHALVSTRGAATPPFIRLKPKARPSPWGQRWLNKTPWANLTVVAPEI